MNLFKKVIENINSEWFDFLDIKLLENCCAKITADLNFKKVNENYLQPAPHNVLRCIKYFKPAELKCIIIGQDPYPTPGHADGLAFSNPRVIPRSVKNIFRAMINNNVLSKIPQTGDLTYLAKQGVLLLNSMLTRTQLIKNGKVINNGNGDNTTYHKFWQPFVIDFIKQLTTLNQSVVVMAWGSKARVIVDSINFPQNFRVLKWCHPVARPPLSFLKCPHFAECNNINWDPHRVLVYTDGGCKNNGRKNAVATWGCYFPNFIIKELSGKVPPNEFKYKKDKLCRTKITIPPTNNRGEWIAVIVALMRIKKNSNIKNVTIVTDSEYIFNIITTWIWSWKKNKVIDQRKNSDLIKITLKLLKIFNVKMIHQKSHTNERGEHVYGNDRADKLCNAAFNYNNYKTRVVYNH